MTNAMNVEPPSFGPGPVQGPALSKAFATFQREVLARMDLRYSGNDFGGVGQDGQVLTSIGVPNPTWKPPAFPSIPNDTVVGNVAGSTEPAVAITEAQLTALINLATDTLSGAMPHLSADATQFLNGVGAFAVPAYPVGANPTADVGLNAVNGTAASFLRSDAAPALDQTISPTWSGEHVFTVNGVRVGASLTDEGVGTVNVSTQYYVAGVAQPVFVAPITGYGTPTGGAHQGSFAAGAITLANLAAAVAQLIIDLKTQGVITT